MYPMSTRGSPELEEKTLRMLFTDDHPVIRVQRAGDIQKQGALDTFLRDADELYAEFWGRFETLLQTYRSTLSSGRICLEI